MSVWFVEVYVNSTIDPGWRIYRRMVYFSLELAQRAARSVDPMYQEVRVREYRRIDV